MKVEMNGNKFTITGEIIESYKHESMSKKTMVLLYEVNKINDTKFALTVTIPNVAETAPKKKAAKK